MAHTYEACIAESCCFTTSDHHESVCCFIDCSKEAMQMEQVQNCVQEIQREDGVTIRLHFSSGGATLQECMVRILEKHIEKSMKS